MSSVVRLRPHHLYCMLTYKGLGYTDDFVCNYNQIAEKLSQDTIMIQLVEGPDDICAPMMQCQNHPDFHCTFDRVKDRDAAVLKILNQQIEAGTLPISTPLLSDSLFQLTENLLQSMRQLFKNKTLRLACEGCQWYDTCTDIADDNFKDVKIKKRELKAPS